MVLEWTSINLLVMQRKRHECVEIEPWRLGHFGSKNPKQWRSMPLGWGGSGDVQAKTTEHRLQCSPAHLIMADYPHPNEF